MEMDEPCSLWAVPHEGGNLFETHSILIVSNGVRPAMPGAVFIQHSKVTFVFDENLAEKAVRRSQILEAELARIESDHKAQIEAALKKAGVK